MVRQLLVELGMPEHVKGHRYTIEAVCIAVGNPAAMEAATSVIYPEVAKVCKSTASRVEWDIRLAVEVSWLRCDPDILRKHFGNTVSSTRGEAYQQGVHRPRCQHHPAADAGSRLMAAPKRKAASDGTNIESGKGLNSKSIIADARGEINGKVEIEPDTWEIRRAGAVICSGSVQNLGYPDRVLKDMAKHGCHLYHNGKRVKL